MKKRGNTAKDAFLRSIPSLHIEDHLERFQKNLAFSFEYFDSSQDAGQDFATWTPEQLHKLLNKLKHYCGNTIEHWRNQRVGAGGLSILEIYESFPRKSAFNFPRFVPVDVHWARFRLEQSVRLVGFVLPPGKIAENDLKKNTFYVVFLDANHQFYLSEES